MALLLEEEARATAGDALPPAYRSSWRRAGLLEGVRPPLRLELAPGRSLWQLP